MRLELAQAKAERTSSQEARRLGWQEADLASRRKRAPGKLEIAVRLRKETTLSVKEIAARLHLYARQRQRLPAGDYEAGSLRRPHPEPARNLRACRVEA
jgi:hypothetical protein